MQNFTFHNPTKIIFGKDTVQKIGNEAAQFGSRALVVSGVRSSRVSGTYYALISSLLENEITCLELAGVISNPVLSKVYDGIEMARKHDVEMIIAVGGGSVLDSAKAIAAGAVVDHDVWDFFIRKERIKSALPVLTVLTLAATGSEMNGGAVITNEETLEKLNFVSPYTYPKVSILDPATTFTVNAAYSSYGAVDAVVHLLEPYFNNTNFNSALQDGVVESLIDAIRQAISVILDKPNDYDARATMMWGATLALNGITSAGMGSTSFPVHMIEHSLSALYNIPHGAGLSIVLLGWMLFSLSEKAAKIARLGEMVFHIRETDIASAAEKTISALSDWFRSINSPSSLSDWKIPTSEIPRIAKNAARSSELWNMKDYPQETIERILELCK